MDDFHDMPGHLIRRAHQISTAQFAEECAGFDLTSVQYAALVAIKANPDVDATRLSALIAFDRSTIGGVLERLEAKGFVSHSRRPEGLTFAAAIDRDGLIGRRLLDVAEKLCGGSLTPLLMNLVRARPLSARELQELQDLIEDARRQARRKGDGR